MERFKFFAKVIHAVGNIMLSVADIIRDACTLKELLRPERPAHYTRTEMGFN